MRGSSRVEGGGWGVGGAGGRVFCVWVWVVLPCVLWASGCGQGGLIWADCAGRLVRHALCKFAQVLTRLSPLHGTGIMYHACCCWVSQARGSCSSTKMVIMGTQVAPGLGRSAHVITIRWMPETHQSCDTSWVSDHGQTPGSHPSCDHTGQTELCALSVIRGETGQACPALHSRCARP